MMKRGLLFTGCLAALLMQLAGCDSKGGQVAILDIDPKVGATQGDQYVKILGKNFRQDIGYTIYFGTKKTNSVTIRDPETIEVLTPPNMPEGKVDIMIRTDDGNAYRIADVFSFQGVPKGVGASGSAPGSKKGDKGNLAF